MSPRQKGISITVEIEVRVRMSSGRSPKQWRVRTMHWTRSRNPQEELESDLVPRNARDHGRGIRARGKSEGVKDQAPVSRAQTQFGESVFQVGS
jgi:hypothetical protein